MTRTPSTKHKTKKSPRAKASAAPGSIKAASAAKKKPSATVSAKLSYTIDGNALLSALPHPIFMLGPDGQFVYVSGSAETFFETSSAMLKRMTLSDIVNYSSPLNTLVSQVRSTGATVNEYAVEISSNRFDSVKLVDVYAGPFPEQPDLTVITLLQRTMAQKIQGQLTHRAAARSVSGMASVLAHEIKNPLSGIRGAAQLLEPTLSDEDRALAQLICTETDRIKNLVDRMEVFGDERPIDKDAVNIHDVLGHVRTLAGAGFASGINMIEDYDPSLPLVPGNRDQLIQAFLNLIKNATEALKGDLKSDRITLRTAFKPGIRMMVPGATTMISLPLMIQIEDNGTGIPDHLKPHLFDPFVTTKTGGTGLGLALVAKIIGDHGGIIECDSANARTVFRILLPMQPTTTPTNSVPSFLKARANNTGSK